MVETVNLRRVAIALIALQCIAVTPAFAASAKPSPKVTSSKKGITPKKVVATKKAVAPKKSVATKKAVVPK